MNNQEFKCPLGDTVCYVPCFTLCANTNVPTCRTCSADFEKTTACTTTGLRADKTTDMLRIFDLTTNTTVEKGTYLTLTTDTITTEATSVTLERGYVFEVQYNATVTTLTPNTCVKLVATIDDEEKLTSTFVTTTSTESNNQASAATSFHVDTTEKSVTLSIKYNGDIATTITGTLTIKIVSAK